MLCPWKSIQSAAVLSPLKKKNAVETKDSASTADNLTTSSRLAPTNRRLSWPHPPLTFTILLFLRPNSIPVFHLPSPPHFWLASGRHLSDHQPLRSRTQFLHNLTAPVSSVSLNQFLPSALVLYPVGKASVFAHILFSVLACFHATSTPSLNLVLSCFHAHVQSDSPTRFAASVAALLVPPPPSFTLGSALSRKREISNHFPLNLLRLPPAFFAPHTTLLQFFRCRYPQQPFHRRQLVGSLHNPRHPANAYVELFYRGGLFVTY